MARSKKIRLTDPLQKPPFAGQPADSLKGMAAGIRAVQLDIPNRVKAAAYLGTVDCVTYPQAQKMLIATMQEDPAEEVRYEAVMALRNMLSRGCGNMETQCECESCSSRKKTARESDRHAKKQRQAIIKEAKGPAKKLARKVSKDAEEERYDCCRGCCNPDALKALFNVANGKDDQCCWIEPSERVREAAAEGLCLCATFAPSTAPEPLDDDVDAETPPVDGEVKPTDDGEAKPKGEDKDDSSKDDAVTSVPRNHPRVIAVPPAPVPVLRGTVAQPAITSLNGFCIVGLKQRQFVPANAEFSSVFEDRTHYFASATAKGEFDANPSAYAPAYGGIDPVAWLEQREMVQGQFLREFNGRFYLFTSKQNWETFKQIPSRFVLNQKADTSSLFVRTEE